MGNLLLEKAEYKTEETGFGTWRRYLYPTGVQFAEFRSSTMVFGMPLLHYTKGICPDTGRRIVAKGFVAVGRRSVGVIAIGQASLGIVAIGQIAIGAAALGQAAVALAAVGQVAMGAYFGLGQLAAGMIAVGQLALGKYVLAQAGFGDHVWSTMVADPKAVEFFKQLLARFGL